MRSLSKPEFYLLILFLFSLPSFEGPTNLLLVSYLVAWVIQSWRVKTFGGSLRLWEYALLLFLAAGFITAFSNPFGWEEPLKGVLTSAKLILPGICLSRTRVVNNQLLYLLTSATVGTLFAVLAAWYAWWGTGTAYPELHSVGHTNQSALYIALAFGISISLVLTQKGWLRITFALLSVFFALAMLPQGSMTATGVVVAMTALAVAMKLRLKLRTLLITLASVVVIGFTLTYAGKIIPEFDTLATKVTYRIKGGDSGSDYYSKRDLIFNAAIFSLSDFPWFGVGDGHFGKATSLEYIQAKAAERGVEYQGKRFFHTSHGHMIVTNFLLNRGIIGLSLMLIFLVIVAIMHIQWLWQYFFSRKIELEPVIGLMAGVYVVVGGLGNSTLYVEHGQLAFCLLGLAIGCLQQSMHETRRLVDIQTYDTDTSVEPRKDKTSVVDKIN